MILIINIGNSNNIIKFTKAWARTMVVVVLRNLLYCSLATKASLRKASLRVHPCLDYTLMDYTLMDYL